MIITVTMNPAIDKTVEIESLVHGGLNRIRRVEYDAGGKGINVSKTIRELGGESIAVGFLGGNTGKTIENLLQEKGIKTDFVYVPGETRTNTKVFERNGKLTELNEPGPEITEEQMQLLMDKLKHYAKSGSLFILAGSVPAGVDAGIYRRMTEMLHEKGAEVLVDADGVLFTEALEAVPDILKPNREELESYMKAEKRMSERDVADAAQTFLNRGTRTVLVSMGKDGAVMLCRDYAVRCPAVDVELHSTVGAGDAMVAALACSWEQKLPPQETMELCMAVSAGAVMTIGTKPPKKELVQELLKKVKTEQL